MTRPKTRHFDVMVRVRPLIKFRILSSNWDKENGFSIKSTRFGGNRLKLDTSRLVHQTIGVPEMKRTDRFGHNATNFRAMSVPEDWGRSTSVTSRDIGPQVFAVSIACKPEEAARTE